MSNVDSALWRDMMSYLREKHAPICRQWFEELEPAGLKGGLLQVRTSNSIQQNYLQKRCLDQFTEAAQQVTGQLVAVRFVDEDVDRSAGGVVARPTQRSDVRPATADAGAGASAAAAHRHAEPDPEAAPVTAGNGRAAPPFDFVSEEMILSPDYAFDTFITGPNNQMAHAASVAVANSPGTAYNPLFIHGGVGLGKTHLLQAICQKILNDKPDTNILYVSCEAFMNQFIECVQRGQMHDFRHRYRHVELLVIDDIHFLANRDRSQEEFFHTFNELYQSNRQIVLSSDAAPTEIPHLEERLVSRFKWGLVAQVSKPGYETRVAIVKAKAKLRGVDMPDEVIDFIAQKVESNARELEGAITTIQGFSALQSRPIDLKVAHEAMGEPITVAPRSNQTTLQNIIDVVTRYYNVKLQDLQSRKRNKSITEPRQVCMWLARKRTRFSLEEIGGYFGGRDHTTVMHSIRTTDDRAGVDPTFARQLDRLDEEIQQAVSEPA